MNNPFEIIKSFFSKDWGRINNQDKSRNFFMINRTCSIQFPLHANMFNNVKIQPNVVVDWWKSFLTHKYQKQPSWVWTKTIKGGEKKKTEYKEEVIDFIKEKHEISNREIEELKQFFPEKFHSFYKDIEKLIS
jgi:hypothetical protein